MYTYAAWASAFAIFNKYDEDGSDVSAEHEIIYAGPDPSIVNDHDKARLEALGWYASERYGCFYHHT